MIYILSHSDMCETHIKFIENRLYLVLSFSSISFSEVENGFVEEIMLI